MIRVGLLRTLDGDDRYLFMKESMVAKFSRFFKRSNLMQAMIGECGGILIMDHYLWCLHI